MLELSVMIGVGLFVIAFFAILFTFKARYKRCPSDKLLVVFGKVSGKTIKKTEGVNGATKEESVQMSAKVYHGGGVFVWPIIQDYQFLPLKPMSFEVNLESALSNQNIRINVPSTYTVAISSDDGFKLNAAERMLGFNDDQIIELARDIIFGQMRAIIATMTIEEINANRDAFLAAISTNVESELKKVGLKLINVNIRDITDESGYITALGKEAAAQVINEAKKSVSEKDRDGDIGVANAERERDIGVADASKLRNIGVAEAERVQRIDVAAANSKAVIGEKDADKNMRIQTAAYNANAVDGENVAAVDIAKSIAERKEEEAEADRRIVVAQKTKSAKALEESYKAEKIAEDARALKEKSEQFADVVVPAQIQKEKIEVDAEAQAEKTRRVAKGDADGIFLKMDAEARGLKEIMTKQAEGFQAFVDSAGGDPDKAVQLMIADKLPEIIRIQTDAIKNIKFDKINVWDSGSGGDGGGSATSNWMKDVLKVIPPMSDAFNMVGANMPGMLQGDADMTKLLDTKAKEAMTATEDKK